MVKKLKSDKIFEEIDNSYKRAIDKCDKTYPEKTKKKQNDACVVGALHVAIGLDKYKLSRIK